MRTMMSLALLFGVGLVSLSGPSAAQEPDRTQVVWTTPAGSTSLELRLTQDDSVLTGYGDLFLNGQETLMTVSGRVSDGFALLEAEPEDGSGYDHLTLFVTFGDNTAQAEVTGDLGPLGSFALQPRAPVSEVLPKLWDNTLVPFSRINPPEIYDLFTSQTGFRVHIRGVAITELIGDWFIQGDRHIGPGPYTNGRVAAWNNSDGGQSIMVFKDSSSILDLGQFRFARFKTGTRGTQSFSTWHPKDGVYIGATAGYVQSIKSGTVRLVEP